MGIEHRVVGREMETRRNLGLAFPTHLLMHMLTAHLLNPAHVRAQGAVLLTAHVGPAHLLTAHPCSPAQLFTAHSLHTCSHLLMHMHMHLHMVQMQWSVSTPFPLPPAEGTRNFLTCYSI